MNRIAELHSLPKGTPCEIMGEIIFEKEPQQSRYGKGLNQFIVVSDDPEGVINTVGVNVNIGTIDEGFLKGEKVIVKGKVDKYPDRTQQLKPDGTYPMKTSVKAEHIEKFVEVEDFPVEQLAPATGLVQVMDADDLKEANKPAPKSNGYIQTKEEERKMWEKKDLIVAKQSACKTVGKWIVSGHIELKNYFAWCNKLVDYFYNEDDAFAVITEANLMKSGLIEVTKAQVLAWISDRLKGTQITYESLGIKAIASQTLEELKDTAVKIALAIGE